MYSNSQPERTMSAWKRLLSTTNDPAATVARLALGLVMLPHGLQKALGLFGGYGFSATLGFFNSMHVPTWAGTLVIAAEVLGSLGLIFGAIGRVGAAGIVAVMLGAVALTHFPNGFFMDWGGTLKGEGYEYHILAIALALVVVIKGSGAWSIDRAITRAREASNEQRADNTRRQHPAAV
jgi:putative oxidoreductase